MSVFRLSARLIAAGVLSSALGAAHASFLFSTVSGAGNADAFAASVGGSIDKFSDLTINSDLQASSLSRTALGSAPIGYTVSTESDLFSVQANGVGGSALTVANNTDTLTFSAFTAPVTSFGIHFFLTDLSPSALGGGSMTLVATDSAGASQSYTFTQSSFSNGTQQFLPLLVTLSSSIALQSVQLLPPAVGSNPNVFATADNLVVASVPEASSWVMMLVGGAALFGWTAARRRA
jgi:hypothetical protein